MGRVLIGVSGGIAAYKVAMVTSALIQAGHEVRVILTAAAEAFVTPLTFATLARHPAYTDRDFWAPHHTRPLHIELGEWAEVFVLAPLTANTLAKVAQGAADNLLTNTVLASTCPLLVAPAMNTDMWQQIPVQRNWQTLLTWPRVHALAPGQGLLACDRVGTGRMAEPPDLLSAIASLLHTQGQRDLQGKRLLISLGSTREHLDPVRFMGNPSTGKMGIALALAAHHRGAIVTVVHGPLTPELGDQLQPVTTHAITTAKELHHALLAYFPSADWTIMAAAVADLRPTHTAPTKLAKADLSTTLDLEFVPDIAADLGRRKQPGQRLIGFAAQTGEIVTPAQQKLHRKNLDAIVANPVDQPDRGFGSEQNEAIVLFANGQQHPLPHTSKLRLAHHLYDILHTHWPTTTAPA